MAKRSWGDGVKFWATVVLSAPIILFMGLCGVLRWYWDGYEE